MDLPLGARDGSESVFTADADGNVPKKDDVRLNVLEAPGPGPDELMCAQEIAFGLRRAVLGLPEPLRFVVTARFWGELAVQEIASAEGISEVAVRKRLKRAMETMRGALEGSKR